ncbi:MAG: DUF1624 domain-containing protein [Candidatus Thermoplasmatota archaeon]|nr:DUF1624 domain-containing protein [Candidatus Thermoplasmatota archaeon]
MKPSVERFWEIDALRGIAIIMMIGYHFLFDLVFFDIVRVDLSALPVLLVLYPIDALFLTLVGISLTLSFSRVQRTLNRNGLLKKFFKRGIMIFCYGLLITLVTWVYPHDGFIVFGVLHCIGLSILLAYPFLKTRFIALIGGVFCIIFGILLQNTFSVDFPWLLWLGVVPSDFYTLDYFPLLPWFGVVLFGVFLGNSLYKNNTRVVPINDHSQFIGLRLLCFLGKHSLVIYLLHQLIIIGLLYLLFGF